MLINREQQRVIDEVEQNILLLASAGTGKTNTLAYRVAHLIEGGYAPETPAAIVYKATWPEEKIFRCTVGTLHETVTGNSLTKTSLIVVGNCLGDTYLRSLLYHPNFTTEFRKGAQ